MFVRTKTTPNSERRSVQIVENTRYASNQIRQKVVRSVGIAHSDHEEEALRTLANEIIVQMKRKEQVGQLSLVEPLLITSEA